MDVVIKPAPAPDELKDVITTSYKEKCQNEAFFIPNGFVETNESLGIKVNSPPISPNILDSSAEGKTANLNAKSSQKSTTDKAQKLGKTSKKYQKSNLTITSKTSVKSNISGIPGSSQEPVVVNNKLESKKYSKNGLKRQLQGANVQKRDYFKFPMNRSRWCDGKGEKPFKCNICEKLYKYMFSLKRHYLRIHINAEYISEADLANCKINVNGDRREKKKDVAVPPNRKRLKTSGSSFENNDGKPGLYKCSFHKVKYDLETELKNHYATVFHPKKEEFICKICKEIFETKAKLCDHVKVCSHINEDVANHCKKCKVTFQSSADYEYHLSIHGNGKFCKYCNKEFSNIANRKRHENLHDGSQSFKCKHCEFSSQAKKDLNIHIRKLHMDLYYRCDKCPKYGIAKIYATKSLLQAHMVERHGEKKELVSKTASPVKLSPKTKSLQNHLKESQVNVVVPKSSVPEIKNNAETKSFVVKPSQNCQSSCVCNLCKKAFPDVRAMLRHKNIAHKKRTTYKRKVKKTIKVKTLSKKPTKKEIEEEQLRFYMNVSHNIADNLLHYVDGTISQLRLSEDSSCNKRILSDPESWNLNFCDQFGKPCSSSIVTSKTPEKVRPPEIFIATGLNKVDDCPNKTLISENSVSLSEFKNEFRLNVLNNDMYFSKQSDTRCFCHICLVKIKEAQKRNVEERKKWIDNKKLFVYVCLVCKEPFNSDCDFDEHCYNNHPLIDTQSILVKIESDKNKPPIIPYDMSRKVNPTPHGILTSDSQSSPLMLKTQASSKCTKCKTIISTSFLHEHILRCGGNESYFVKKHFRKRMRRKRIKNTMKHRLDLTIKQLPSGERKRYKDFRIQKAKFKYDKNYFNFKNGKSSKGPFASVKETTPPCSACNKKFPSQAQLKNHQCSADKLKKVQRLTEFNDFGFRGNADLNLRQKEHCKRDLTPSFHSTALSKEQRTQNGNLQNKHPANISSKYSGDLKVNMSSPQPCHVSKLVDSTNFESAMDLSISKKSSVLSATPDKHTRLLSTVSKDLTKSPIDALKETIDRLTNKEVTEVAIENSGINKDSKIVRNKDKMIRDSKGKISNSKISTIVKIIAKKDVREKNICPGKDLSCEKITANKNVSGVKPKLDSDLTDGQNKANKIVTNEKVIDTTGDKLNVIKGIILEEGKKKILVPPSKNVKSISMQSNPTYLEQNSSIVVSRISNSPEIEKERDQTKSNSNFMKKSKKSLDEALKKITKSKPQIFDSALEVNKAASSRNTENYKIDNPVCLNKIQPSLQANNLSSKKETLANTQLINITRCTDPKRSCDLDSHENISILTASAGKSNSSDSNISESNEPKCMQSDDNILSVSKRSRKKLTPSKIVQSKLDVILPVKNTDNNLKETINNKIKGLSQSIAKQLFSLDSKSNDSVLNAETVTDARVSNQSHDSSKMNNLTNSETDKVVVCNTGTKSETEVTFSSNDIKKTKPLISNSESSKKTESTVAISEATVFNSETSKNSQIQYSNSDVNKKCGTPVSNLEVNNKSVIQVSNSETNKKAQTVINNSATNKESRILPNNAEVIEKTETTVTKSASKKKTEISALSSELGIKSIDSLTNLPINITGEVPAQLKAPLVNQISCNSPKSLCSLTTTNSFKTIQAAENKSEALPVLQAPVLFLSNECLNSEVASSQDRDSPTLEVLVSSVTQNLENFDEQSCMDDDKFSISDPTEEKDGKISKTSLSGSLNFKVIMPEGGKLGVSQPLPLFPTETMKTTEQPVNEQLCIASNFPNLNQNNTTNNVPDNFSVHDSLIKNVSGASFNKKIPSVTNFSINELAKTVSTLSIPHMSTPVNLDDSLTSLDVSLVNKETPKSGVSGTRRDNKNLNDSSSVGKIAEKEVDNLSGIYPKRNEKEETKTLPVVMASVPSPIKAQKSFESEVSLLHKVSKTYSKNTKTPTDLHKGTKSKADASDENESVPKTKSKLSLGRKGKKKSSNELDLSEPSKDECSSTIQLEATPTSVSHLRAFRREQNDQLLDASESKSSSSKSDAKQKDESVLNKDNLSQILDPDTVNDSLASLDQKDIKKELEGEANVVVKRESEGAKKHACPYCMLEFAYLTNFRRHTRQCRSKAGIRCSREQASTSSSYFMQHLPKKEEVEESMLNLLRHQIRQNQMIQEVEKSDVEKEIVPPEQKKLQTYTCPHCHKIFLKLFEQVRHLTNVHLLSNEEIYLNNQKDVDQSKLNNEGSISALVEENFSEENVNAIRIDQNSTSAVPISGEETFVTNQKSCPVRTEKVQDTIEKSGIDESEQINPTNASEDVSKEDDGKISKENSCLKDSNEKISDTTELVKSEDDSRSNEMNLNESIFSETPISNTSNSNQKELVHRQKNKSSNPPLFQDLPVYGQGRGRKKKSAENDLSSVSKRQEMLSIPCLKEESSSDSIDQRTDKGVDVDEDEKDSCSPKKIVVSKLKDTISHKMRLLTSKCPVPGPSNNEVKEEDLEAKVSPDSYLSRSSSHDSNAFTCEQSKSDIQPNTVSGASVAEREQILSTSSIPKRGRGRKSAPNLNTCPDSKPVKGRKKRFSDSNVSETSHNDGLVTSESPKRSKRTSAPENNTTKLISSLKTPPKRKGFRNKASEASAIHSKTDSSNNVPQAGIKDLSSSSLPSTSSLSNFQFGKVKRLRRSRFPNYCDSESSFSSSMIPYDHSDSDDFVSSPEKRPVVKKKVLQKVCPICKKKFTASLERNRHVQLVHSRKGLETEESPSTPSVQITENKPKKEVESPKSRTSFTRQCAKPLPPMKRKYEKQPSKELPLKRFK
ncbi:serine-rich adhesin for platelets [Parasteatoda tepidariorum]|uniref:serine-rich adhesin for platelets n=1 Tax=Parasteatoda tepidariorum TaxID=114398 RepID=UPI00077F94BB|nr:uncharacterized protein LOC107436364 [Parasteatoda tepidariorum]XP_015903538.1 uncharacterized protein LOC107436364 [Parasteatoda tepidariorum]XP_015903539.1 uncharacterized protein LOC107436364 [Parasteatoda tepidariorum]XP_042911241.1 uncharacterized protein LOC107436364 [Parasteatoda tepidariorum]XP_042911242.1 uncharacterized protein LOC107436364 [Parasteatoda tepidariorum]